MDGDTEAFLARHHTNTLRYMSKLNLAADKAEKLDVSATLKRLQDKYGLTPERPEKTEEVRVSVDEQGIKNFIENIRKKYLVEKTPRPVMATEPEVAKPVIEASSKPRIEEPLIDLSSPVKQPDLLTGPPQFELMSLNLSPSKPPTSPIKSPLNESVKHSPRNEGIINHLISSTISKRLGLCLKKPQKPSKPSRPSPPAKLRNFDSFLASRPVPVRTTRHRDIAQVYLTDSNLQSLLKKEQSLLDRLQKLKEQKEELAEQQRKANYLIE